MFNKIYSALLSIILLVSATGNISDMHTSAYSAVAMDADSGHIFYQQNKDTHLPIASTTKIMTCLIACESGKLNESVKITSEMLDGTEGTMIYLKVGDVITLYDLVCGAMLASGNDAAKSIAVYLSGSENRFANRMNRRANKIGMHNTEFSSASGLDIGTHYSSAYDMAKLSAVAIRNKILSDICSQQSAYISINGNKQKIFNHNKLLSYDSSFIGFKTGFTQKAGRCLVSAYKYKQSVIVIVTLNDPDDWNDHLALVDYAKDKYNVYSDEQAFMLNVVGAKVNTIRCYSSYDVAVIGKIEVVNKYYPIQYATVSIGDTVGTTEIYCDDKLIMTVEITAEEEARFYA